MNIKDLFDRVCKLEIVFPDNSKVFIETTFNQTILKSRGYPCDEDVLIDFMSGRVVPEEVYKYMKLCTDDVDYRSIDEKFSLGGKVSWKKLL